MRLSHTWPSLPPSLPPHLHFTWHSALHLDIALTQQAEVEELKDTVYAQQNFVQMQQDEIAALTGLTALLDAQAVAPTIDSPAEPVSYESPHTCT